MIHQFRDKKEIARKKKLIKNLILTSVFLLFASLGLFAYMSGFLNFIGRPIWQAKNAISTKIENSGYLVRTKESVFRENENLLKENADLKISMIDYNILKDENIKLKEILGRPEEIKNFILANILTKPNSSPYDTIIIDIGNNSGIYVGDTVYSAPNIPIGEVSSVYGNTSLVTLYSNPGQVTEAMMDVTNASVELIGRGGGNFEMIVPAELSFENGTMIYMPNLKTNIVAIIQNTISSPNDPVKKVLLSSPVNIQNLKWVFVKKD